MWNGHADVKSGQRACVRAASNFQRRRRRHHRRSPFRILTRVAFLAQFFFVPERKQTKHNAQHVVACARALWYCGVFGVRFPLIARPARRKSNTILLFRFAS